MNLTDRQVELLRAIVSGHESNGGQEFVFIPTAEGGQLVYPYGPFIPVPTTGAADFIELRSSKLITIYRNSGGHICGQPTQSGIETVREHSANFNGVQQTLETDPQPAAPTQRFMRPPSRFEIETYADEIFRAGLDDRNEEYSKRQAIALSDARTTNNAGAYVPALIECKKDFLRTEILLRAEAMVEAATIYGVALGQWAHKSLQEVAMQMAAGANSALRGELDLHAIRLRTRQRHGDGAREIHKAMTSALAEGKIRLKKQMIQAQSPARPAPWPSRTKVPNTAKIPKPRINTGGIASIAEIARRRQTVLDPILRKKQMTVNKWADAVDGVSHSTVFRYYNGECNPRVDTLGALAAPLGLKAENLPL